MITETDDFFCHQIAEPHEHVLLNDPSWAERAFFTVSDPERFGMDIGVSMYANNDRIESYAVVTTGAEQVSLRAGDDLSRRWPLRAGPITAEVLEPMTRWRLACDENDSGIAFDLEFIARTPPFETRSPYIRKRRRLVYDNVNMFQGGRFHGELRLDGRRFAIDGVPGHRDRTWGVRSSGEGRIARGLLTWVSAEFDDLTVMALIHERHDGTPVRTAGYVGYEPSGELVELVGFAHDLSFDHDSRLLQRARYRLTDARGELWDIEAEPVMRLLLAGAGYTSDDARRGAVDWRLWTERWRLDDPATVRRHDGLNDSICRMRCGGRVGHGIAETLIGEHDRYTVAPLPPAPHPAG